MHPTNRVYLDYAATTPVDPVVQNVLVDSLNRFIGNPSSIHLDGREAKRLLEQSRETIAKFLNINSDEIVFTSGGTEADNLALLGTAYDAQRRGKNHVITSAIEHSAIQNSACYLRSLGFKVDFLTVDSYGIISSDEVKKRIRKETFLISIMHSNNEIGTIEPIEDIINIAKEREIIVHSDMVQSLGKVHLDLKKLKLDLASFSSHKLYGPKGIGCLFIRKGVNIIPLLFGGNQEINRRAGTENVPQIAAFAKAVEINCSEIESHSQHLRHLREYLLQKISNFTTGFIINGHPEKCLPNILSVSFESRLKQIDGEALLIGMDLRGVSVSSGSACTSGAMQPSKVLLAIGRDILTAKATIRFSFGKNTTTNDLDFALNALKDTLDAMNY